MSELNQSAALDLALIDMKVRNEVIFDALRIALDGLIAAADAALAHGQAEDATAAADAIEAALALLRPFVVEEG